MQPFIMSRWLCGSWGETQEEDVGKKARVYVIRFENVRRAGCFRFVTCHMRISHRRTVAILLATKT